MPKGNSRFLRLNVHKVSVGNLTIPSVLLAVFPVFRLPYAWQQWTLL